MEAVDQKKKMGERDKKKFQKIEDQEKKMNQNGKKTEKLWAEQQQDWKPILEIAPKKRGKLFFHPFPTLPSIRTPRYLATCAPDVFFFSSFAFSPTHAPTIVLSYHTVLFYCTN